jgi:N-acetylmuramic acid 6-phosphate etherase
LILPCLIWYICLGHRLATKIIGEGKAMTQSLTESRNPRTVYLDRLSTREQVKLFMHEDRAVFTAIEACAEPIALAVEQVVRAFNAGGRLVYVGAGTSGRLGVLDASECAPTFGVPENMVVGLIAGGDAALQKTVEGAQDDAVAGREQLEAIQFNNKDLLLGISASGHTPFVGSALSYARSLGATTILLTCNPYGDLPKTDILINPVVGPEVISGSTRLKCGTACKMILNMLSSISMIRMGKVFENLMVNLKATNKKLQKRALRIVMEGGNVPNYLAEAKLEEAGGDVKLAILLAKTDLTPETGRKRLEEARGVLYRALGEIDYE